MAGSSLWGKYPIKGLSPFRSAPDRTHLLPAAKPRTLLDWLRVEYAIEKPSNKLLALTELDSNTWVSEVKRIRGKTQPLSSAGLHALRDEYIRTLEPARAPC